MRNASLPHLDKVATFRLKRNTMLAARLQTLHGSHKQNSIPLCSAVISNNDASAQEQKNAYSVE